MPKACCCVHKNLSLSFAIIWLDHPDDHVEI